ncbi:AMP-dependent synthetase/ligase [Pedomonas mirosovicensis]|uniref:AMP-dependent synthetase/ligase n=1 Tax=Pedomonas mirosovicensis TaxID=2908641 RepID=UPI00216A4CFD|nr:AMP-dependent synthetase/ligase [Pedomonas mirosovicensis]MCH8683930.1 AMP-dependent synthetase/ligase [Pedomonas mirosovicensis]
MREDWNSVVEMFFDQAERLGDKPFLWTKREGHWQSLTWRETAEQVARLAGALKAIGIKPGERIALVSENRPEWLIADLAIMTAGAITVPAYTSNTERDHLHILENSGAVAVFVSGAKLARLLLPAVHQTECCCHVIAMEPVKIGQSSVAHLYDWQTLIAASTTTVAEARSWATFKREDTACLIYTSGTGGAPRGVKHHHGAILHNVSGAGHIVRDDFAKTDDVFLSFLPLSHAYEHTGGQFLPIWLGAEIYYAEGLDKLAANIEEVHPTIMVVVPRLFEVLRARMTKTIEKQGAFATRMLDLALHLEKTRAETGQLPWWGWPADRLLDATLRSKVQARFGGRLKAMVAGGAPLNPEVGLFFAALGFTLLQGYGQTEAGPIISCNRPSRKIKMHTVGPPLANTEVRIAEDGEILVRGELVTHGYWRNPDETERTIKDGWLHTGDVGHIDADGHIVITDRKKDIIVLDKGENVSPQRVEGMLCLEPEIHQAMVYGDRKPYLVGLIVPDPEWAHGWASRHGEPNADLAALKKNPGFCRAVMDAVDRINARLSVTEKVRRISLASEPFTVENEQMTPTLKIRRHKIKATYGPQLEALYRGG